MSSKLRRKLENLNNYYSLEIQYHAKFVICKYAKHVSNFQFIYFVIHYYLIYKLQYP